jgi:hypothetical protein
LNDIPHPKEGGTGLFFVDKSHSDFALPFWNGVVDYEEGKENGVERKKVNHDEYQRLEQRYGGEKHCVKHHMPMSVGDLTVHSGWTLHCTQGGSNSGDGERAINVGEDRYALAVSYVDARAQVREGAWEELMASETSTGRGYSEDRWSFQEWLNDVKPRKYFEHDLVPIVWPKKV